MSNAKHNPTSADVMVTISQWMKDRWERLAAALPKTLLVLCFIFLELVLGGIVISQLFTLGKIQVARLFPIASDPVARFVTKIDWEKRTVIFDASASKTYNDKVAKYIWRIDDGSSAMDTKQFTHTFTEAGYYEILFSLVDTNKQSDQADCRILFPPKEMEQVVKSAKVLSDSESKGADQAVEYTWIPKGTFFNYSKLSSNGLGDLRSPFVETGCGYSNTSYNTGDIYENVTALNLLFRRAIPTLALACAGMIVIYGIYRLLLKKLITPSVVIYEAKK